MTIIDNAVYRDGRRVLAPTTLEQTWAEASHEGAMAWVGLYRPDEDELQEVARALPLHALAVEDALAGGQRAKLERYGEDWFMVLRPARYVDATETVEFGEIDVFFGAHHVVTVRHAEEPDLAALRGRLEQEGRERLRLGPPQVAFEILDRVVDDYVPVADGLEQDIAEIEDQIFAGGGDAGVSRRIYELSREVLNFQHAIRALPTMIDQLAQQSADLENQRHLRDVHDHAQQINDRVAAMRTMLSHALELDSTLASKRLAEHSVAQNEEVKRISSWAAIIFAPQLIGSIYGMNFRVMPELHWALGYPFALSLMALVALILFLLFKRVRWL